MGYANMGIFYTQILALTEVTLSNIGVALIGALSLLLVQWIKTKLPSVRDKKNGFQALIDANTAYREEVRRDLKAAKEEVWACKNIIEKLEIKIKTLEVGLKYCEERLLHKDDRNVDD